MFTIDQFKSSTLFLHKSSSPFHLHRVAKISKNVMQHAVIGHSNSNLYLLNNKGPKASYKLLKTCTDIYKKLILLSIMRCYTVFLVL